MNNLAQMMKQRYDKLTIKAPMEFDYIFSRLRRLSFKEVLPKYSRDRVTRLAVVLNREYVNEPAMKLIAMLNSADHRFYEVHKRIEDFYKKRAYPNINYVVGFETTSLELLRRAYSISQNKFDASDSPEDVDKLQYATVRLVTQINENLMEYHIKKQEHGNVAILTYTNSASNYDILHFDSQTEYLYQLTQAVTFFKLLEGKPRYATLLEMFYRLYGISNWREYVRTLVSVFGISLKEEGTIPGNLSIDADSLMSKSVLDRLSIDSSIDRIQYASKNEFDKEGNSDYRIFRDKPLFKLTNGDYVVHSKPLLTDRLYSSLYFDFMKIAEEIEGKHPDIPNLFTSDFMEKTMFGGLMNSCLSDRYEAFDEDSLKKIHKIKDGELGYPDYMLKSNTGIVLFECKDIRLNAWIKEKRDYELLERELKNKLVCKTYKLDYDNCTHVPISPKRIGCGQIAGHVANVRNSVFPWDTALDPKSTIYPVLVIADNRLLADGLSNLLQRWFCECLSNEGLDAKQEKPLIIMSPITLLKYSSLFEKYGFERYFEEYYASISQIVYDHLDVFNKLISFDDYMSQYPFKLKELGDEMIKEMMADRKTKEL